MRYILTVLLSISFFVSQGQGYFPLSGEKFGKNRIQVRQLKWSTINSNNFEFNFYRNGQPYAYKAAKMAEEEYPYITDILGYTPYNSMKVFIYNSEKNLNQSNIGLTAPQDFDGGLLNLSRSRIEIAYPENDSLFKLQLIKEISNLFVYDMLYGGSLKEVLQNSILLTVPDWYMKGISSYIADRGLPSAKKAEVIAAINRNDNKKLDHLLPDDAELLGQSIWHYIALKYGTDNISNILNLTRIIRTEESSITSTLGISYPRFVKEWKAYYLSGSLNTDKPEAPGVKAAKPIVKEDVNQTDKLKNLKPGEIDTEYYEFEEVNVLAVKEKLKENVVSDANSIEKIRTIRGLGDELNISRVRPYQNLLLSNDLNVDIVNDPVRRMGLKVGTTVNDLLENHIFNASVFVTPTTKNHDINLDYTNYSNKTDWGFSFNRRSILFQDLSEKSVFLLRPLNITNPRADINRRLLMHSAGAHIFYPLSESARVEVRPSLLFTSDIDYIDIRKEIIKNTLGQLNLAYVYDNTKKSSKTGLISGTKARLSYEKNISFKTNSNGGFNRINLDLRHFQNLTGGLQLVGRFNYGTSSGDSPRYSFLGGTENTINRNYYLNISGLAGEPVDITNFLFYNFPGNLRGFDFGKLYGTRYMLFNMELRASLAGFFPRNTITSSLIRNLQLVAFNDIGTAWSSKKGPWSRENSLNTQLVGSAPFFATVRNFKNPFLMGYGVGARTSILGFYVRADYAFGIEDKEIGNGKFYLSVGKDL